MTMSVDRELEQALKDRFADTYTSAELCDLLDLPVEDLIEEFWDLILQKAELFEQIFITEDEEE